MRKFLLILLILISVASFSIAEDYNFPLTCSSLNRCGINFTSGSSSNATINLTNYYNITAYWTNATGSFCPLVNSYINGSGYNKTSELYSILNDTFLHRNGSNAPAFIQLQSVNITTPDAETEGITIFGNSQTYTPTGVQPNTIDDLSLWLKADAITGLSDGNEIVTWTDSSGDGHTGTAAATARPIYKTNIINGKPVARFDGSNDLMKLATAFAPQTLFIVFNYNKSATFSNYDGLFTDQGYTVSTGLIGNSGTNDFYVGSAHFDELKIGRAHV
jgi:hypothetical protein